MQRVEGEFTEERHVIKRNIIGISETIGLRQDQEDAMAHDTSLLSKKISHLTEAERHAHMSLLFLLMQVAANENPELSKSGSCACLASGWYRQGHVYVSTSYVGDSVALLVGLDQAGELKYAIACNPDLHNVNYESEIQAIKLGQGRSHNPSANLGKRLAWELSVTRSIGDPEYEEYGLCHAPETTFIQQTFLNTDQVYLVVACDGAMEHLAEKNQTPHDFAKELGDLFTRAFATGKKTAKYLAQMIKDNAVKAGSKDNISVMVMPIDKKSAPITAAVFDGHEGAGVAQLCKQNFVEYLKIVSMFYKHMSTKINAQRQINEFDAIIHAILTFDTKTNYLPALRALIKEIKTHVYQLPDLMLVIQWLEKIRNYYLQQLKVLHVVPEHYVLDEEVKATALALERYQLSEQERKQKEAVMELYLYLQACDLKHCKALTLIKNKLCDSFGKPGEAIHGMQEICQQYHAKKKLIKLAIKFPFTKQASMEGSVMLLINDLVSTLTAPAKEYSNLSEILQAIKLALGVKTNELVAQPVAYPNQ